MKFLYYTRKRHDYTIVHASLKFILFRGLIYSKLNPSNDSCPFCLLFDLNSPSSLFSDPRQYWLPWWRLHYPRGDFVRISFDGGSRVGWTIVVLWWSAQAGFAADGAIILFYAWTFSGRLIGVLYRLMGAVELRWWLWNKREEWFCYWYDKNRTDTWNRDWSSRSLNFVKNGLRRYFER